MKTRPWYIWLSIIAFIILWGDTARKILRPTQTSIINSNSKTNLWFGALGQIFLLFGTLILIMILFTIAYDLLLSCNEQFAIVVNVIQLVFLYFNGVFITNNHVLWREKNLPGFKK